MRSRGRAGERFIRAGRDPDGRQVSRCAGCARRQAERSARACSGYRSPPDVTALAVGRYLRSRLSYAEVTELPAERGIRIGPTPVCDRVQAFTPLYRKAARTYRHPAGGRWATDETSITVGSAAGRVFRALDEHGRVVDSVINPARDAAVAVAPPRGAIAGTEVRPHTVTTRNAAIYPPALAAVPPGGTQVAGKPEQQPIDRGHLHRKGCHLATRGFKQAPAAQVVCAGHGFMRNLHVGLHRLGPAAGDPRIPRTAADVGLGRAGRAAPADLPLLVRSPRSRGWLLLSPTIPLHRPTTSFFARSLEVVGHAPTRVTSDDRDTCPRAVREMLGEEVIHRCSRYLNNRIGQDHRSIEGATSRRAGSAASHLRPASAPPTTMRAATSGTARPYGTAPA